MYDEAKRKNLVQFVLMVWFLMLETLVGSGCNNYGIRA